MKELPFFRNGLVVLLVIFVSAIAVPMLAAQAFWDLDSEVVDGDGVWQIVPSPSGVLFALTSNGVSISVPLPGHESDRRIFNWQLIYEGSATGISQNESVLLIPDYQTGLHIRSQLLSWSQALKNIGLTSALIDGSTIYAGGDGGQLFVSTDNGENWTIDNLELLSISDDRITQILRIPSTVLYRQGNYVFVPENGRWEGYEMAFEGKNIGYEKIRVIDGRLYTFRDRWIYESVDGKVWTKYVYENKIWTIDDFIINGNVILISAVAWPDIFIHSKDGGETWSVMQNLFGEELHPKNDLALDTFGYAYVAAGKYVVRSVLPLDGTSGIASEKSHEIPVTIRINSIFPNPVSHTAQIDFSLDRPGNVEMSVFDIVGRKIETIAEGYWTSGNASIRWNPRLPNGSYVIRLKTENRNTHRLVTVIH